MILFRVQLSFVAVALALAACQTAAVLPKLPAGVEARSLLGEALIQTPPGDTELARRENDLELARAKWKEHPEDPGAWIWYGRRMAYLGRFRDAVALYTQALERFPDDPRLLRHRGHRWITLRRLEEAEDDLARAAELCRTWPDEPELPGTPDPKGVVRDTLHRNVHYHLALVRFLRGEFETSLESWKQALALAPDAESRAAVLAWASATLLRLGRASELPALLRDVDPRVAVSENRAYQRLCLFYRGDLAYEALLADARPSGKSTNDAATIGFALGNWQLARGEVQRADELFENVRESASWPAFGVIAAEAELARMRGTR